MITDYMNAIKKCALFEGIEGEELHKILHCLQYRIAEYEKNDYAAISDNKLDGVGIVLDGEVAVVKESVSGNRTRVNIFHPGEMFGEVISLCREEKWPASIQALTDCTILYIHPEKILDFCESICSHHKILLANLVRIVSQKAYILSRKVEYLSLKSIKGKLSKYLLEQHISQGKSTFTLPLNREELAEFLNISRPSMSRELCKMRDEGILEFYKESIKISDFKKLESLLEN
jgi:CRP/FNR family transcriptional regulator, dissimilatory nitrate respiration regulator